MVGMIPLLAAAVVNEDDLQQALVLGKQFADLLGREDLADAAAMRERGMLRGWAGEQRLLLSLAGPDRLKRLLTRLFDENEFLSPHGLRALSAYHREHPYVLEVEGVTASIDYEPAESTTPLFGGNSNWRGPVWFPLNYLVINALERYHQFFGRRLHRRVPDRVRQPADPGQGGHRPAGPAHLDLHPRARTAGGRASAGPSCCRTIRPGGTT